MKIHLFEFRSAKKKLKCLCGWEMTLKSMDVKVAHEKFAEHCLKESRPAA